MARKEGQQNSRGGFSGGKFTVTSFKKKPVVQNPKGQIKTESVDPSATELKQTQDFKQDAEVRDLEDGGLT